ATRRLAIVPGRRPPGQRNRPMGYAGPSGQSQKATLQRVAAAAQVSLSTVDRVINKRGGVSPALELRVLEAADALRLDRILYRVPLRTVRVAFVIGAASDEFFRMMSKVIMDNAAHFDELNIQFSVIYCRENNTKGIFERLKNIEFAFD